ncbi:MAG: hypothetical protein HQK66_07765 [Desulfamplus sp.]|nr:hypothetical protein [Desulfamplus sp.]
MVSHICLDKAYPANLFFQYSSGYDSNPAEEPEPDGYPFSDFNFQVADSLSLGDFLKIEGSLSTDLQVFRGISGNHAFNADISLFPIKWKGRVSPYIFSGVSLYRDSLIPSNKRDQFTFGSGFEFILSSRYTLIIEPFWRHINYLEDSSPLFLPPMERNLRGKISPWPPGQGSNGTDENILMERTLQLLNQSYDARRDRVLALDTLMKIFLMPNLTLLAGMGCEYLSSSLDMESYFQVTPTMGVYWDISDSLQVNILGMVESRRYRSIDKLYHFPIQETHGGDGNGYDNPMARVEGTDCPGGINGPGKRADGMAPMDGPTGYCNHGGDVYGSYGLRDLNHTYISGISVNYYPELSFGEIEMFAKFSYIHGEYPVNEESYNRKVIQCGFSFSF